MNIASKDMLNVLTMKTKKRDEQGRTEERKKLRI